MTVELTPEMETIVADRLSSGRYSSAQAVLEEALYAMKSRGLYADPEVGAQHKNTLPHASISQKEQEERARSIEDLFARIDAEGPF